MNDQVIEFAGLVLDGSPGVTTALATRLQRLRERIARRTTPVPPPAGVEDADDARQLPAPSCRGQD